MVKYSDKQLDLVFYALSHSVRRKLLRRIMEGHRSVMDLAQPFKMSLVAISKHLKVLERAGLILRKKSGRQFLFESVMDPIEDVETWMKSYTAFWDSQLDSLDDFINS